MSAAFKKSDQRELAQQIAADLNEGVTRERHAEVAASVLTSDWLAAHDREVEAKALEQVRKAIHADGVRALNEDMNHLSTQYRSGYGLGMQTAKRILMRVIEAIRSTPATDPEPTETNGDDRE